MCLLLFHIHVSYIPYFCLMWRYLMKVYVSDKRKKNLIGFLIRWECCCFFGEKKDTMYFSWNFVLKVICISFVFYRWNLSSFYAKYQRDEAWKVKVEQLYSKREPRLIVVTMLLYRKTQWKIFLIKWVLLKYLAKSIGVYWRIHICK